MQIPDGTSSVLFTRAMIYFLQLLRVTSGGFEQSGKWKNMHGIQIIQIVSCYDLQIKNRTHLFPALRARSTGEKAYWEKEATSGKVKIICKSSISPL